MDKKIRVLHVGLSANYGGIESFVVNYFKVIDKNRFIFDFADIYGNGIAYKDEIESLGGNIFILPNYKKHLLKMRREYVALIKRGKYDIIHIHMLSCANMIPVNEACKLKNVPIVVHCHSSSVSSGMIRRMLHCYNRTVINRLPIYKWACGIKAGYWMWESSFNEFNVISNAVDTNKFKLNVQLRKALREEYRFDDSDFVLGFVGKFCEAKNLLFLVSVLEKLKKKNGKFRLLMIGDGELKEEFIKKAYEKKVNDFVCCVGTQSNVSEWYSAMDCFVLPSKFEGLPFVAIEAQAAGLQSYISNLVTTEVKVTNGVDYLPIDNDGDEWAEKIDAFCKKYGTGYRHTENIPDKYDINKSCKNLENKYLELLEEK